MRHENVLPVAQRRSSDPGRPEPLIGHEKNDLRSHDGLRESDTLQHALRKLAQLTVPTFLFEIDTSQQIFGAPATSCSVRPKSSPQYFKNSRAVDSQKAGFRRRCARIKVSLMSDPECALCRLSENQSHQKL